MEGIQEEAGQEVMKGRSGGLPLAAVETASRGGGFQLDPAFVLSGSFRLYITGNRLSSDVHELQARARPEK